MIELEKDNSRKACPEQSRRDAKRAKFGLFPLLQRGTKEDFAIQKISPSPLFQRGVGAGLGALADKFS
jgi:hypothetical protein